MAYNLLNVSNKAVVLIASISTTWPPLWYVTEQNGKYRRFLLFSINFIKPIEDDSWGMAIVVLPFSITFAFPWIRFKRIIERVRSWI